MSYPRKYYAPTEVLAAYISAHRAACSGDARVSLPTVMQVNRLETGIPPGTYRVEDDGGLVKTG